VLKSLKLFYFWFWKSFLKTTISSFFIDSKTISTIQSIRQYITQTISISFYFFFKKSFFLFFFLLFHLTASISACFNINGWKREWIFAHGFQDADLYFSVVPSCLMRAHWLIINYLMIESSVIQSQIPFVKIFGFNSPFSLN